MEQADNAVGVGDLNHNLQQDEERDCTSCMMVTKIMTKTKTMINNMKNFDQEAGDEDITR